MATAWLSYAWKDNESSDVDFTAQELIAAGLQIKLDRWNIQAGKRLWEQIEQYIQNPSLSDAWILYATQNSLGSEPCREEFAYALDRALKTRGSDFPVIGLFSGPVDMDLIPAAIRIRLFVSVTDPDWKERIVSTAERRSPAMSRNIVQPYQLTLHLASSASGGKLAIELRPRAGTWAPFFAAIPIAEKSQIELGLSRGPRGSVPHGCVLHMSGDATSDDGRWHITFAGDECTPTQSYYVLCRDLPSQLVFGVNNGAPQFIVTRNGSGMA